MTAELRVELDISQTLAALSGISQEAMRNAWRRAFRKTGAWLRTQLAKSLSSATQIPQETISQRLHFFLRSIDSGKIWIGVNKIEAHRLGPLTKTGRGLAAGSFDFPGAWTMTRRRPNKPAYERVGAARRPYREVTYDFSDAARAAFEHAASMVERRLLATLSREVETELRRHAR